MGKTEECFHVGGSAEAWCNKLVSCWHSPKFKIDLLLFLVVVVVVVVGGGGGGGVAVDDVVVVVDDDDDDVDDVDVGVCWCWHCLLRCQAVCEILQDQQKGRDYDSNFMILET